MSNIKLAEALLRRKELQDRLDRMKTINSEKLFEVRAKRVNVTENVDEVTAGVPKMTWSQFSEEYNYNAKQLRLVDAAIQQANWTTIVEVQDTVMRDWTSPNGEK